ncbi:Rieske domain-containing protein [Marine Group I thaumarchaeote SCGC RSA3]|uniref:Cytochrome b6-f complex iron-sulfur subunit protein n=3 Tax=Marine Group I TaxID=905826 RepID=A0A081RL58_9ARCH|nr:Cytochrome b6-f complex iron-sulfur subunit protein [Marine Group I thaumarchaeote SCGC AAA799-N04]KFM15144.1 Cytochrome b6-f complex iron-sulfur subunit protein [Marine Group I thaumarchaeote SCGC AAA799-D11]KFM16370.1 Rieske domain-containing protein [Marine Group I thaumarchaeote SCGC RSA3]
MSEVGTKKSAGLSRRDFLKLMGAAGTGLAFAPFVPFGNFMPNPNQASLERVPVILPDGTQANINTYPINHAEVITYPATGDAALDAEAFRKWQFIRLPEELGGAKNDVSAFRAFSMICLHLWCLWKYWPDEGRKRGECPCHGSMYDPVSGTAFVGPASVQAAPSNTLPKLTLEADSDGLVYIMPPKFNAQENGVIGYGRFA